MKKPALLLTAIGLGLSGPAAMADPLARALLPLCDGTRDRAALLTALMSTTTLAADAAQLDESLAMLAQCALLRRP